MNASVWASLCAQTKLVGTPYSKLDCQAFVEQLLTDAGIKHPNWRGSNHMWRDALSSKWEIIGDRDTLQPGVWVFTIKRDGGEVARGYKDNEGNAAHVGVYVGGGRVLHSTTGGVQWDDITSKRWTHAGKCRLLEYDATANTDTSAVVSKDLIRRLLDALNEVDEIIKEMGKNES